MAAAALDNWMDEAHPIRSNRVCATAAPLPHNSGLTCIKAPGIQSMDAQGVAVAHATRPQIPGPGIPGFGIRRAIRYGAIEAKTTISDAKREAKA